MMTAIQKISEYAEKVISTVTAWHFNPPSTPHMSGVWEQMVRSVKEALRALDDGRKLTDRILSTTLAEAKNTQPFTNIPQKAADEEAITPNHFLCEKPTSAFCWWKILGTVETLQAVATFSQQDVGTLVERILPSLNHRTKWFEERKRLQ